MSETEENRRWEAECARLNAETKAACAAIELDDQPNKFARQCRAQVDLVEALCPLAPKRALFELYETLQDMWEAEGPIEALEVVCLEMRLEAVDDEIEKRTLRQEYKIFLRTRPRRRSVWARSTDEF